jgi:outer membrane receptor protein involved in Fe transport
LAARKVRVWFAVPPVSVANPNYNITVPLVPTSTSNQDFDQVGVYTQDQIKSGHWIALPGVRWDNADSSTHGVTLASGATTTRNYRPMP